MSAQHKNHFPPPRRSNIARIRDFGIAGNAFPASQPERREIASLRSQLQAFSQ